MDNIQKPDWKKYQPSLGQCRKYKGTLRACQSDVWYNTGNSEGGCFENILAKCSGTNFVFAINLLCHPMVLKRDNLNGCRHSIGNTDCHARDCPVHRDNNRSNYLRNTLDVREDCYEAGSRH
ncbi:MAG: hypothetical protein UW84_C0020G0030 [Candidatus Collierbacteria bacterium GW2011_GWA2_44_99]|uniref:Uncharacterized protein n=1 Tax=Candidatus Collierbacteria bacterium GW2011_GWA2_44_99 TaxID=1618380 RepID=A0A0G1NNV0_9BACT|nr:MAG: hypothetical protein UW84_C0020G0030 [Candidatus Collierbacteria bacterium GW2011_GWA2_44_99]